jgi:hypothetical protein
MQEAILLAVHPWCTIEQAREKELKLEWCMIVTWYNSPWDWSQLDDMTSTKKLYSKISHDNQFDSVEWRYSFEDFKKCWIDLPKQVNNNWHPYDYLSYSIIGLPPTLERTLVALGKDYYYIANTLQYFDWNSPTYICDRKLLNDNWTPASLFDQDEETQNKIAEILWYKDLHLDHKSI